MRASLPLLFIAAIGAADAAVYRWVDEQGGVHYSDEAAPGAEEVYVAPLPTYTAPPAAPAKPTAPLPAGPAADPGAAYALLAIRSPQPDEAVRANDGNVSVALDLVPGLQASAGHRLRVTLDGQVLAAPASGSSVALQNLDRGEHTVQVAVVDAEGRELIVSPAVSFNVLRVGAEPPPRLPPFRPPVPAPRRPSAGG